MSDEKQWWDNDAANSEPEGLWTVVGERPGPEPVGRRTLALRKPSGEVVEAYCTDEDGSAWRTFPGGAWVPMDWDRHVDAAWQRRAIALASLGVDQ